MLFSRRRMLQSTRKYKITKYQGSLESVTEDAGYVLGCNCGSYAFAPLSYQAYAYDEELSRTLIETVAESSIESIIICAKNVNGCIVETTYSYNGNFYTQFYMYNENLVGTVLLKKDNDLFSRNSQSPAYSFGKTFFAGGNYLKENTSGYTGNYKIFVFDGSGTYSEIELPNAGSQMQTGKTSNKILFSGGSLLDNSYRYLTNFMDSSLSVGTVSTPGYSQTASCKYGTTGNIAVFPDSGYSRSYAYDDSMTKITCPPVYAYWNCVNSIGGYVFSIGGIHYENNTNNSTNIVETIDETLTLEVRQPLIYAKVEACSSVTPNSMIIYGGHDYPLTTYYRSVEAYLLD